MEHSEQINEIVSALSKAQAKFTNVPKTHTAKITTDGGKEFTYTYASLSDVLEMVRAPIAENNLALNHGCTSVDGKVVIVTLLSHSSGQWFKNTRSMPLAGAKNPVHAIGSSESYGRRYDVCAMLGIASEEDLDAAEAEAKKKGQKPSVAPSTQRPSAPGCCKTCGVAVSDDVRAFSQKKFGEILCMTHQPKAAK